MGALFGIAKQCYELGCLVAEDDKHDIGYFSYKHRPKGNPHIGWGKGEHESPLHHWQMAAPLILFSQVLGAIDMFRDLQEVDVKPEPQKQPVFALPSLPTL